MIVKSSFTKEHPQKDGRVWVCERHVHDDGEVQEFRYLAEADLDLDGATKTRATAMKTDRDDRAKAMTAEAENSAR